MVYKEAVPLCHYCHSYIHAGRTEALADEGRISRKECQAIMEHGRRVLREARILAKDPLVRGMAPWHSWRLVVGDREYPPEIPDERAWQDRYQKAISIGDLFDLELY
jgi:hypothetical protein